MKYTQISSFILILFSVILNFTQYSFSQIPTFDLVGRSQNLGNDCYYVTNLTTPYDVAGDIWSQEKINLNKPFILEFLANFGNKDGDGADGIVFVLHNDPRENQAIGSSGGGIGYRAKFPYDLLPEEENYHLFIIYTTLFCYRI